MLKFIINGILALVVVGFGIAVLESFDWDIFAVIEWMFSFTYSIVDRIAEFFSSNKTFQEVTSAPVK